MTLEQAREKYAELLKTEDVIKTGGAYDIVCNVLGKFDASQEAIAEFRFLLSGHFPNDRLAMCYQQAINDLR